MIVRKRVVIIGAGPAGIACAIQLKRYGLDPYLIERDTIGGLLLNAHLVENYPGFPSGIPGRELGELFERQLEVSGIGIHKMEVKNLAKVKGGYHIKTESEEMESESVVVASGTKPKELDIENGSLDGTLYYEVKVLRDVEKRRICVLGGGDVAFDYALGLSRRNRVTIVHRGNDVSCLPLLYDRAKNNPRIRIQLNSPLSTVEVKEGKMLLGFNSESKREEFDIVIAAIGRIPSVDFLSDSLMKSFINKREMENLYFIGDVARGLQRQVGIAVGDGIRTAMEIQQKRK
jgi:thioredoxin reductase (NADPH)